MQRSVIAALVVELDAMLLDLDSMWSRL